MKYKVLGNQIKVLRQQNRNLSEQLRQAMSTIQQLRRQNRVDTGTPGTGQATMGVRNPGTGQAAIERRMQREARRYSPDASDFVGEFFNRIEQESLIEVIEYYDVPIVSIFRQAQQLLQDGFMIEIRGIRQDVNRPFNFAFRSA